MSDALKNFSTKKTPQNEQMLGKDQVENSAGGFVFKVDKWERLNRFLILGSDGGTYYIKQKDLTKQNVEVLSECFAEDGVRVIDTLLDISTKGRAPKNDPAIFVLAFGITHGDVETRRRAAGVLSQVCRTGTHLFQFANYIENLGGWGPIKRRAVASWYQEKSPENLAYQLVKYRQREGFTHHDMLHLSHPKPLDTEHSDLYHIAKEMAHGGTPTITPLNEYKIISGYRKAQEAKTPKESAKIITEYNLPRECVKTEHLNDPAVWEALLPSMPITALIRNLGNMSKVGLLTPLSDTSKFVINKLADDEVLRKGRVHPLSVLLALTTYQAGHGVRGSGTWSAVPQVVDALDAAFYKAFGNVEPIGNNVCLALDVSSSMGMYHVANTHLSAAQGSCALAMVTARTEPNWMIVAFTSQGRYRGENGLSIVSMSPTERLDDLVAITQGLNFGSTDCALPMLMATQEKWPIDTFIIYTDSETWAGNIHPTQALEQYRQKSGRAAKLVVVGMTSNGFTIADPDDSGMLDVVGFDASVPNVISDFSRST